MPESVQSLENDQAGKLSIRRIHLASINNPYLGQACWLDEFDLALLRKDFTSCQELLTEIYQGGYQLTANMQVFVESRQAALQLCQGLSYHRLYEYDKARQAYEASRRLHHTFGNSNGEGQALRALEELDNPPTELDNALLEQLAAHPSVLGDSSTLLTECLAILPLAEQMQIVILAKESGYYAPLLAALSSSNPVIQAAAATALTWLKPGPDYNTITETMLTAPNWLVRWQAISMLQQRINEEDAAFVPQQDHIRMMLSQRLEAGESDPMVRRAITLFLLKMKNTADTSALIRLLIDPDPDVRYATIKALDALGDTQALPALQQVQDGRDFAGSTINVAVKTAIRHIHQRLPAEVQEIVLCREVIEQDQPVLPLGPFSVQEPPRYCVVTLSGLTSTTSITCSMRTPQRVIFRQERTLIGTTQQYVPTRVTPQAQENTPSSQEEILSISEPEELLIELIGAPQSRELDFVRQTLNSLLGELLAPEGLLTIARELTEAVRDQIDRDGLEFLEKVQDLMVLTRDLIEIRGIVFLEMVNPLMEIVQNILDEHGEEITTLAQSFRDMIEESADYDRNDNLRRVQDFFGELIETRGEELLTMIQPLIDEATALFTARQGDILEVIEPLIDFIQSLVADTTESVVSMFQPLTRFLQDFINTHEREFLAIAEPLKESIEQFTDRHRSGSLQGTEGIRDLMNEWNEEISTLTRILVEDLLRDLVSEYGAEFSALFSPLATTVRTLIDGQRQEFLALATALDETVQDLIQSQQAELPDVVAPFIQLAERIEMRTTSVKNTAHKNDENVQSITHVLFALPSKEISWSSGDYSVEIALNGVVGAQQAFKIIAGVGG